MGGVHSDDAEFRPDRVLTTILFTDIVDSTARLSKMGDQGWRHVRKAHDDIFREKLRQFGGEEIGGTGDGFLVTFSGPAVAIFCARAIGADVRALEIDIRAGLHVGECHRTASGIEGIAVHIAARVVDKARPGELLVTSTVKDLLTGADFVFDARGVHRLRGIPGTWRLFAVRP
jgi:class 3 adenylate cyclase